MNRRLPWRARAGASCEVIAPARQVEPERVVSHESCARALAAARTVWPAGAYRPSRFQSTLPVAWSTW